MLSTVAQVVLYESSQPSQSTWKNAGWNQNETEGYWCAWPRNCPLLKRGALENGCSAAEANRKLFTASRKVSQWKRKNVWMKTVLPLQRRAVMDNCSIFRACLAQGNCSGSMALTAPRYLVVWMTWHHPNLGTLQLLSMIWGIVKTIQVKRTYTRKTQFWNILIYRDAGIVELQIFETEPLLLQNLGGGEESWASWLPRQLQWGHNHP